MSDEDVEITHECSAPGCTNRVRQRRRSQSGTHWCRRPECRAAKQRWFRRQQAAQAKAAEPGDPTDVEIREIIALLGAQAPRMHCDTCGAPDAIRGLIHPNLRREATDDRLFCFGVGNKGELAAPLHYLRGLFPESVAIMESRQGGNPE